MTQPAQLTPITLRVSLTDRCNFRCHYCMPAQGLAWIPRRELPSLHALATAVEFLAHHLGVQRVKLTGGEPLVRPGVVDFVARLRAVGALAEISLTTNGTHLARLAGPLKQAGLARVNVSLDTLDPQRFRRLTRGGELHRVLAGISAALEQGLTPVKLNAVLCASSFRHDVPQLVSYAAQSGLEVRFIELMRTGTEAAWAAGEFVSAQVVQEFLRQRGELVPLDERPAGPARRFLYRGAQGEVVVGWITPVSHSFCQTCNRLRLDARGFLRRCLMDEKALPLLPLLSQGERQALQALAPYLAGKRPPQAMESALPMSAVGG
ncbi:MAG: GTP 3',8-cyclase MoaA [Thermoanaerobaculum sp.]|nr:GTP 3',8-cyclase MoaA [Thermoanaerobaculum sp.]MDW7968579.1 GTP 3',8-cyclase MoaA [Thermoanaerobaculum sp.]